MTAPPSIVSRNPNRSAIAPINACDRPQTMFWTAIARVKSAAVIARSRVTGVRNSPRLCRSPMPRLSRMADPIRIGMIQRRDGSMFMSATVTHSASTAEPLSATHWAHG